MARHLDKERTKCELVFNDEKLWFAGFVYCLKICVIPV